MPHFHDTLGGSSIPSAYPSQLDALGYAATVADETLQYDLRRRMNALPEDTLQRIVAFNASDCPYSGFLEFEPWLDWLDWDENCWLSDSDGKPVPVQRLHSESQVFQLRTRGMEEYGLPRLLFPAALAPGELRVWHIERLSPPKIPQTPWNPGWDFSRQTLSLDNVALPLPHLALIDDPSDTWAHGLDRFAEEPLATARFTGGREGDTGPLLQSRFESGVVGSSPWHAEWRAFHGERFVELHLRIHWQEERRLLKLVCPQPTGAEPTERLDGIPGTAIRRANDGRELPLRDWTRNDAFAVVAPEVYGIDATGDRLRLTLLRSPILAHHAPHGGHSPRRRFADQGEHEFRFRFFASHISREALDDQAFLLQRPPLIADLTRGMKAAGAE